MRVGHRQRPGGSTDRQSDELLVNEQRMNREREKQKKARRQRAEMTCKSLRTSRLNERKIKGIVMNCH